MILLKYTLLIIFTTFLFLFAIYLIVANQKKIWPFKPKNNLNNLNNLNALNSPSIESRSMSIISIVVIILFVILFIVLIVFSIKMTIVRYQIAEEAIQHGQSGVALSALAPEIGIGVGSAIYGPRY